jgi:2'-5' RNA ligase
MTAPLRLFVALNVPDVMRKRLHRAAQPLRDQDLPVRWVAPAQYHVTLKFLGDVPGPRQARVEETLTRIAHQTPPLDLRLAGFGAFPTIRQPRILWAGVDATPELRCLKQDIEWGLAEHGFVRETRAFHPHFTLARTRAGEGAGVFRGLDELMAGLAWDARTTVRKLDLMRSRLSPAGSRYSIVRSISLAGSS